MSFCKRKLPISLQIFYPSDFLFGNPFPSISPCSQNLKVVDKKGGF
jgi:hypothetical protein